MNAIVIFVEIITADLSSSSAVLASSTINIQTITTTLLSQLSTIILVSDLPAGSTVTLATSSTLNVITMSIDCSAGALAGQNLIYEIPSTSMPTNIITSTNSILSNSPLSLTNIVASI